MSKANSVRIGIIVTMCGHVQVNGGALEVANVFLAERKSSEESDSGRDTERATTYEKEKLKVRRYHSSIHSSFCLILLL